MPRKPNDKLNPIDRTLRQLRPPGMTLGSAPITQVEIRKVCGFELHNDRPHHNHETWSDGYQIADMQYGILVHAEDLDDAMKLYADALAHSQIPDPENNTAKCKGCGEPILWGQTEAAKNLCVNPSKTKHAVRFQRMGKTVFKIVDTFVPHWVTCPKAQEFRKKTTVCKR
jgi:hypothetical protein